MIKYTVFILLFFNVLNAYTQETEPTKPKHAIGNMATQLKAFPLYIEGWKAFQSKDFELAKRKLRASVNLSFDLTESQLLLGDILYTQGIMDSAMYYYKSGIDFVITQEPHFYFRLFETCMLNGEYDFLHQFLKNFKKLYGKQAAGLYEENFPYTVDDYQFYEKCDQFIHNFEFWLPTAQIADTFSLKPLSIGAMDSQLLESDRSNNSFQKKQWKRGKWKTRNVSGLPDSIVDSYFCSETKTLFFSHQSNGRIVLSIAHQKGRKWNRIQELPEEINASNWTSHPFYNPNDSLLYFSDNRNGNKDLFVAKYSVITNKVVEICALTRINTDKNEIAPYFVGDQFFWSTNGLPGFGGMDIFQTKDYEKRDGFLLPMNFYNLGSSFNSSDDELSYIQLKNQRIFLQKKDRKGNPMLLEMEMLPTRKRIHMDQHIEYLNTKNN